MRLRSLFRENERVALIMVSTVIVMAGQGVISPVLPLFAKSFGVGAAAIGLTLSAFAVARMVLNVPLGILADRRGRRILLIGGPIVSSIGMIGSGASGSLAVLLAWRVIAGAGSAMYMTGAQIYLTDISTPATRGRVIGTNQGALLVGVTVGPAIGGVLGAQYGFRVPFYVVGVATLGAAFYGYLRLPETLVHVAATEQSDTTKPAGREWLTLLTSRNFAAVCLVSAVVFMTRAGGRQTLLPLKATEEFGYTVASLGGLYTLLAVVNLAGVTPSAFAADRFGRKRTIVPSGLVMAFGFAMLAFANTRSWFIAAALVTAAGTAVVGPAPAAYAADIAPPGKRGLTLGMYRTAGDLGFVVGPVVLGWLADTRSMTWGLGATAVIAAAAMVTFARIATETVTPRS